jgi:hypothetical protein
MLVASAHICLAACQTAPGDLLPSLSGPAGGSLLASTPANSPSTTSNTSATAAPTPYMRCVTDFWGNCTGVASNRHDYRWRYVRPGARPKALRESATARANAAGEKAAAPEKAAPRTKAAPPEKVVAREKSAPKEKAEISQNATRNIPMSEKATIRDRPAARNSTLSIRDNTTVCHARRRVVGDERPSQDDARRAAENGWMGAVRYDYGERYQDINRAKDVRLNCGPSSTSAVLKTPHFRCSVEATPCRETQGTPTEPDERRYDPPVREDQISRK